MQRDLPATHLLCLGFHFWEPVFFNTDDTSFPSDSPEERGHFVGMSENFGHDMTFKILNSSTKTVNRHNVRLANDKRSPNLRTDPETSHEVIKSLRKDDFEADDATS